MELLLMSGEASFITVVVWSTEYAPVGYWKSLYYSPAPITWPGTWCIVWCEQRRITGSIFFHGTFNFEQYINNIVDPFFEELTKEEKSYMYFQQDSAPSYPHRKFTVNFTDCFWWI